MAFAQPLELPLRLHNRKIRVQIAIVLLRLRDQIHNSVRQLLQMGIRLVAQGVRDRLQPFIHITILKDPAVMLSIRQPCRDLKILDRVALFVRNRVIIPLALNPDTNRIV